MRDWPTVSYRHILGVNLATYTRTGRPYIETMDYLRLADKLRHGSSALGSFVRHPRAHHHRPCPSRTLLGNEQTAGFLSWRAGVGFVEFGLRISDC